MLFPFPRPNLDNVAIGVVRCLVLEAIRKGWFRRDRFDDLVQDAIVHLLQKAHHYDPEKARWSTFSAMVVRNYLSRLRKGSRPVTESLDAGQESPLQAGEVEDGHGVSKRFTRHRTETEWIEFVEDVAYAIDQLPNELREICEQFQQENSVPFVAKQLNLSRSTVYRRRQMIRESVCFESLAEYR